MTVKVFKMINGEEIITKVSSETDCNYIVKDPAQIIIQQTEQGMGVGLAPYMAYVSGELKIYKSSISSEGDPDLKMENEYRRIFGSGIQIAPAGSIQV